MYESILHWFNAQLDFLVIVCVPIRYPSSCGILLTHVPPLLCSAMPGQGVALRTRSFFSLADSFSKRKEYSERRIIGFVSFHLYGWCAVQIWSFYEIFIWYVLSCFSFFSPRSTCPFSLRNNWSSKHACQVKSSQLTAQNYWSLKALSQKATINDYNRNSI